MNLLEAENAMNAIFSVLDNLSPLFVWGLFPRLLGMVYLIVFASLFHQALPFAGSRGISPIKEQLQKIRSDYPGLKRFFYFPTLLWIKADDWFIRLLLASGIGASVWTVYGGPWSRLALVICWAVFLSFNLAIALTFPWDCLLLEAGFIALFLPSVNALPDISATALPLPAVGWAYRWLIFRLVLGFGKFKFIGTNAKELGYLKPFLACMPLPNYLGWYAYRLPGVFHKLGLATLFIVEILLPFLIFVPGEARILAAFAIIALMVVIQLTGNWGHFNILAITLCVTLFDHSASIFDQPLSGVFYTWSNLFTHTVALILFIGGLVYFPFNSWCTQAWIYWPSISQIRFPPLRWILNFYRALAPFRIIHAYGVFPPESGPPVKWVPIIEGTQDGKEWKEYQYRYTPSQPSSPPKFVAPHHPRLDHAIFYESFGTDAGSFLGTTFGVGNPNAFTHFSWLERLVQRLLEGDSPVVNLFSSNPFPDAPPTAVRVNLYMFQPTSHAERIRTGAWWRRRYVGPHLAPATLNSARWEELLPDAELFHWDELIWKRRAARTKALMDCARNGCDSDTLDSLLVDAQAGITPDDVMLFWESFVKFTENHERQNWKGLPELVQRIRQTYPRRRLRAFEKILGRLSLALLAKLEPHYSGERAPQLEVKSFFHLGMLIHYIIGEGKETYLSVFHKPALAASFAGEMTTETGFFYTGVFWYETLVYHARKFRLLQKYYAFEYEPGLSGFVMLIPFITEQFEIPGEEKYVRFARKIDDGEWFIVDDEGREKPQPAHQPICVEGATARSN